VAVLGADLRAQALWAALACHVTDPKQHPLGLGVRTGSMTDSLRSIAPEAEFTADPTAALLPNIRTVVLAGTDPELMEIARRAMAEGRTLLVLPHVAHGSAFLYEVMLTRDSDNTPAVPLVGTTVHPAFGELRRFLNDPEPGGLRYLELVRTVPGENNEGIDAGTIRRLLLPDVVLLRELAGDYDAIMASYMGTDPERETDRFRLGTVILTGSGLPTATWTIRVGEDQPGDAASPLWSLRVVREQCEASLNGTNTGPLRFHAGTNAGTEQETDSSTEAEIERAIGEGWLARILDHEVGRRDDLTELVRAQETVEATEVSRQRQRTIGLRFESMSERMVFKTRMTAVGCSLLTFTLPAVVLVLVIGTAFDLPAGVMRTLRVLVFLPLFVFLAAQLFLLAARPPRPENGKPNEVL